MTLLRRLRPGSYVARVTTRDAADDLSAAAVLRFRVRPGGAAPAD